MGVGLSLTAILYSPFFSVLWLVGMAVYMLVHLREVKLEPYGIGLLFLTMWSFAVAVFYESWVSVAATAVLASFFLLHQWFIAKTWREDELDRLFGRLFHLGTGTALIGWLQQMGQWPTQANVWTWMMGWVPFVPISEERISGTFSNPNFAASWYAALLVLGLWMWERSSRSGKWLVAAQMVVLVGALYFTGSRGGLLAWLCGTGVYWLVRYRRQALLAVTGLAAMLLTVGWFRPEWLPRGNLFWQSLETRLDIWQTGLKLWMAQPLTGIGLAKMWFLPPGETAYPGPLPHAHHTLLSVAVDLGLIGLLLFLWMQVFVWRGVVQLAAVGHVHVPVLAGVLAVLAVHGLVDHPLFLPQVALLYFGASGLVVSMALAASASGRRSPHPERFRKYRPPSAASRVVYEYKSPFFS